MSPSVSVIIRAKDGERWISHCLQGVFSQTYKDFEVILVDNNSSDKTVQKARQFAIRSVVNCTDYRPGRALNLGIRESRGRYVVCLSGHCIPVNEQWLAHLVRNMDDPQVAGVYGRQEPMSFTPDADKRDLVLLFGLDRKVQHKDSFFHNANSLIRKAVWQDLPFDETVTNIEDRVWAEQVLQRGSQIIYEPEASVYHHHGVHHDGNVERCANVMRIIEQLHADSGYKSIEIDQLNIVAFIPVRGDIQYLNAKPLLAYTIEHALESRFIKRTIVSTDNPALAKLAEELGAEAPFLRGQELSGEYVTLVPVLQYSLEQLETLNIFPDAVVSMEITFPFRPAGLLDDMIAQFVRQGFDSVLAGRAENRAIWKQQGSNIIQLEEGMVPRKFKEPTLVELRGIGVVTHSQFIREGSLLGQKVGIYEVNNPYSHLEVRSEADFQMATLLLERWSKLQKMELADRNA